MSKINPIDPLKNAGSPQKTTKTQVTGKQYPSFKETLSGVMKEVNDIQHKADKSIEKMVAGEITDVHQVMNSVQEAKLAFNMMMEIRNKVMEAYQEVMRMRL
jgi:flagellar hook-basal body complex protein FliE